MKYIKKAITEVIALIGADDAHLNLNNTKLWVCVVVYRAVKFVAGLMKIKI